jgi:hypothetical protein
MTAVILAMLAIVGMAVVVLVTGSLIPALASLAAVAVLVAAAVRVDLALLVLVASAPLENALQVGDNPLLTLTKVAGFLTFFGFAVNAVATRRRIEISWTHGVVVVLLLLALVSTVQARDEALALVTTFRYASFVALYFVVSQMARDHRMLRRLVWALSLVAALAGVLALRAYLSGEAFAAVTPGGDPNDDAFGWITILPLTLWLFTTTGRRARVLLVVMVATMITASLYSLSRGALLGLAAGIAWEILVERRHIRLFVGAAVAALVASIVVLNVNPQQLRISLLGKQKVAAYNVEARLDAWGAAADLAVREPGLGIGPGNFGLYYGEETGKPLSGKTLAMIFTKSSTRTRVSFEVGAYQLGGHALFLSSRDIQLGRGEPIRDTARVLSRYVDGIMIRTFQQSDLEELAEYGSVPVINGLTDLLHPCQIMADMMTIRENLGDDLSGVKVAWVGDGNNMANSWLNAAYRFGFSLRLAVQLPLYLASALQRVSVEQRWDVLAALNAREEDAADHNRA